MTLIYRDEAGASFRALAWSPDGRLLVSATSTLATAQPVGNVHIWDAANGEVVLRYDGHPFGATGVAWSPDGARIASAGGLDGTTQVWDAQSGEILSVYLREQREAVVAALHLDGSIVHTDGDDFLQDQRLTPQAAHTVYAVSWLAGGERVVSTRHAKANVFDAATGTRLYAYASHRTTIAALAVSPDGMHVATVTAWLPQIWQASDKAHGHFIYRGHVGEGSSVASLAWSPDGRIVASGSTTGVVRVWDAISGATISTYRGHNPDESLIFNPSNGPAQQRSYGSLYLEQRREFDNRFKAQWLGDERFIGATAQESLQLLDEHMERLRRAAREGVSPPALPRRPNTCAVYALTWSPDSMHIASGSWDQTVQVWDARTGERLHTYTGHSAKVMAVAWSPDGARIASADAAGFAQVWPAK